MNKKESLDIRWQKYWKKNNVFKVNITSKKPKFYVLDMFPYPSGAGLHVGHPKGYTATDIIARYKKLKGFEVLHPMGFDAFGLPAEQYAIQTGNSPDKFTDTNIKKFKEQLNSLGFSYDWDREVITSKPWYYKHTQWIFAQLHKNNLTEYKEIEVNWSPSLNTVLSNEEVILVDGVEVSERDNKPVIRKKMKQWVLKITKYADKLFKGLDALDWPESIKSLQKNWIYEEDEQGKRTLHLRDWIFARQRYWGEPFPILHKKNGEIYLIPEKQYPIELPKMNDYKFSQDGKPALSKATKWLTTKEGERDVNTMPQWAGSCWYYLAYILKNENKQDILNIDSPKAKKLLDKWLPVDLYIGGQEHAVLHLLYARFWHLFLVDLGLIKKSEPFQKLFTQGMILGPDGSKMSKSKGNVINPDDIVNEYGADTLRLYEMFMGPLEADRPWSNDGVRSSSQWIERVVRFFDENKPSPSTALKNDNDFIENKQNFNQLLSKTESYIESLKYNVYISEMMIFINGLYKTKKYDKEMAESFLKVFSLVCPHTAEEIWQTKFKNKQSIYLSTWPIKYKVQAKVTEMFLMISINGKVRGRFDVSNKFKLDESWAKKPFNSFPTKIKDFDLLIKEILTDDKISKYFEDKKIKKIIYIHNKLVNFVL